MVLIFQIFTKLITRNSKKMYIGVVWYHGSKI